VNIGAANDMDTFGKRILPQVIQEIRFSAYCARKLQASELIDGYRFEGRQPGKTLPQLPRFGMSVAQEYF
jgi:hypothetical protein